MKVKAGDIVEVWFLDHVCTSNGVDPPIKCRAIGEVLNADKTALYIASWLTEEQTDFGNMDTHTILKTAIIKTNILRKKGSKT